LGLVPARVVERPEEGRPPRTIGLLKNREAGEIYILEYIF